MPDHDEQAFLATVDPAADKVVRRHPAPAVPATSPSVPFTTWSYRLHADDTLDVDGLPDEVSAGADELWAPAVDLRYALRGGDLIPTDRAMGYLFARHGDAWYLRSDTALDGLGRRTWRGPWDFGAVPVTTTRHGIVLSHPGNEPDGRPAGPRAGPVRAGGQRRLADVLVAAGRADAAGLARARCGRWSARTSRSSRWSRSRSPTGSTTQTRTVAGQRVVLSPTGVRALSIPSLRVVLRHEITHLAARADTVDGSPTWLLEGFADYVGYRDSGVTLAEGAPDLAKQVRDEGPPTALPEDRAFRSSGSDLDLAYQQSWSLARYVADRYGEDTLVELYRTLAAAGPASARRPTTCCARCSAVDRARAGGGWQYYLRKALE